jgi:hypothetical protein
MFSLSLSPPPLPPLPAASPSLVLAPPASGLIPHINHTQIPFRKKKPEPEHEGKEEEEKEESIECGEEELC